MGRKTTLVAALLTMGISTVLIGALPTYATIGLAAPLLLALCRFGQGLGLGGEYGWRIPFLASAVLVIVGLYVRLTITETPVFQEALDRRERVKVPMLAVFHDHPRTLLVGTLMSLATFVLFYLTTVFALSWGTTALGFNRDTFLMMQLLGIVFFALTIPVSAVLAERGRRRTLIEVTIAIGLFGLIMAPLFVAGMAGALAMMIIGQVLMGLTYGPLGTALSEQFPTSVRYTGSSLTFNLAGIFGASLAPYIATWLATNWGLAYVGYYLSAAAALTLVGLIAARETKDDDLSTTTAGRPDLVAGREKAVVDPVAGLAP